MPLLEDWNIPSRLASLQGYAGCHEGYVTDLARHWLKSLDDQARSEVELYACGPHVMLEAVVNLAREFDLPVQVSLEEFMACAVGGCAGCVVEVETDDGPAMKRVCVDGPIFDGYKVFEAFAKVSRLTAFRRASDVVIQPRSNKSFSDFSSFCMPCESPV